MKYLILFFLITSFACTDAPTSPSFVNNTTPTDLGKDAQHSEADMGKDGIADSSSPEDIKNDTMMDPKKCGKNTECENGEICKFDPITAHATCVQGKTNNGDACLSGTECTSGLCIQNACADLCEKESDCAAGFLCKTETLSTSKGDIERLVCVPEKIPCLSNQICPAGKLCVLNSNDALECQTPTGRGNLGEACNSHAQCSSNICIEGSCSMPCERANDCSAKGDFLCEEHIIITNSGMKRANICLPKPASACLTDSECTAPLRCVASKTITDIEFSCGAPNAGGKASGQVCATDNDCTQNLCVNQICAGPCQGNGDCSATDATCELVNVALGNGNTDSAQICAPPVNCIENADCRVSETCYIRSTQAQTDIFCRTPNVGAGSLGQVCSIALECNSNYCLTTRFRDVCTETCNEDGDCPLAGYSCQSYTFNDGHNAQICQPLTPSNCTSNNDCAAGTICSLIENPAGNSIESVCVPSTGGDAAGVACQQNNTCASLLCLDGFCSAPCADAAQCPSQQLCQDESITIGNSTTTIKLCKTPAEISCADSSECTDGVRVCSLTQSGNNLVGQCAFPNPNGSQMGSACTASSQCRENICLTNISDSCSVVCNDDGDCAAGLGCTTYGDIGFCNAVCADNSDCSATQICTINSDVIGNDVDSVCQNKVANGADLGGSCTGGTDCTTGLCLTTTAFTATACTQDTECTGAGETCACPIDQPNCNAGKRCATKENLCTNLCNDSADCSGGVANNTLTACSSTTVVQLPNGQGTKTIATCARP